MLRTLQLAAVFSSAAAWPGMGQRGGEGAADEHIGPSCTVNAHGSFPDDGPCPNMEQPPAPNGTLPPTREHKIPARFTMEWSMYFVPDASDAPPYFPEPQTPFNVTTGRTYYETVDEDKGLHNMKVRSVLHWETGSRVREQGAGSPCLSARF
jgi:hypothetical protein